MRGLGILLGGFGVRAFLGAILTARLRLIFSADHLQSVAPGLIALTMIVRYEPLTAGVDRGDNCCQCMLFGALP